MQVKKKLTLSKVENKCLERVGKLSTEISLRIIPSILAAHDTHTFYIRGLLLP